MKRNQKILLVGCLLCIFPMFLFLLRYNQLPAEIPIQFSFSGEVSNTAPKAVFVFIMPIAASLLNVFAYAKGNGDEDKIIPGNLLVPAIFIIINIVTFFMI